MVVTTTKIWGTMIFFILISWPERIIIYLQPNYSLPVWSQTDSYGIYYRSGKTDINIVPPPLHFVTLHSMVAPLVDL